MISRATTIAVSLLLPLFACSSPDPQYCTSHADCADNIGAPYCDINGEYGVARTCIADPNGTGPSDGGSITDAAPDAGSASADAGSSDAQPIPDASAPDAANPT